MPRRRYEVPDKPFITTADMRVRYGPDFDPNVFGRWVREGKVRKLRNGLYLSPNMDLTSTLNHFAVANQLYKPSYISLEAALRYYNFIPETVYHTTSVTPLKTQQFRIEYTVHFYRTIDSALFFGYHLHQWKGTTYAIASPEKALLDFAYLEPQFTDVEWVEEMRFDEFEIDELVDWEIMNQYARRMGGKAILHRLQTLKKVVAL
ncbi:type IV toxin-antitoxin system AbiEi family antitoxin domain-containing protein [Neolewinella sp.]|uniref:type IV toxin-antitoxin system AbiEi family antitoxin domain-containing protein n=1 Tax=Neolewinella sp. TaxID=2993543 RepID=UPI003B52569B